MSRYDLHNEKLEEIVEALHATEEMWWEADSTVLNYVHPGYVKRIERLFGELRATLLDLDLKQQYDIGPDYSGELKEI